MRFRRYMAEKVPERRWILWILWFCAVSAFIRFVIEGVGWVA